MIFRWTRDADPRWQDALDEIAPRTERGPAWLKIVWHPGETWCPVQRWVIYQMMPLSLGYVPPMIEQDLRGPNPRLFGYWSYLENRFIQQRTFTIDRMQWCLYQDTGCYAKPLWVIQGAGGGHKRRWDELEASMSIALGGGEDPPTMGKLPYAEFDGRVVEQLRRQDMLLRYRNRMQEFVGRDPATLDREERARAVEMRNVVWNTLTESMMESMTFTNAQLMEVRDTMRRASAQVRTTQVARPIDGDEIRDHFINAA